MVANITRKKYFYLKTMEKKHFIKQYFKYNFYYFI